MPEMMSENDGEIQEDSGQRALENVRQVLEGAGLTPQPVEPVDDITGFALAFEADGPPVSGSAYVLQDEEKFLFYLDFLPEVPVPRVPQVIEFVARANFGITVGNFEVDYQGRSVRYKSSIDFQGTELEPVLIRNAILGAMDGVETYAEALLEVMAGSKSAQEAIERAESSFYS